MLPLLLLLLKYFSNSSIVTGETDKQSELKRMSCNAFFELPMYQCNSSSSKLRCTRSNALTQQTRSICYDIKNKIMKIEEKRRETKRNAMQWEIWDGCQLQTSANRQPIALYFVMILFAHVFKSSCISVACSSTYVWIVRSSCSFFSN